MEARAAPTAVQVLSHHAPNRGVLHTAGSVRMDAGLSPIGAVFHLSMGILGMLELEGPFPPNFHHYLEILWWGFSQCSISLVVELEAQNLTEITMKRWPQDLIFPDVHS